MKIQPGIYQANIFNYTISETKSGEPQAAIVFEYNDSENQRHEITWFGTFKAGKGQEITLKALVTCGFKGSDLSILADGVPSQALDVAKPVRITIEEDTKQDGSAYMRVRWVNDIARELKSMDRSQVKVKLGALNLAGQLAYIRSQSPAPKPTQAQPGPSGMREPGEDDDFSFGGI